MTKKGLAAYIDHTVLRADATIEDIKKLCAEADSYGFASVCVNPSRVAVSSELLKSSSVEVCTVCGFPLGAVPAAVKAIDAAESVRIGADEVDMVINIGAARDGEFGYIESEIRTVREACRNSILKVIIETCYLSNQEIVKLCQIGEACGADFLKTSTGFGSGGADLSVVSLMKKSLSTAKVKAAGGIRTLESALQMIDAGADRIGTSAGIKILDSFQ